MHNRSDTHDVIRQLREYIRLIDQINVMIGNESASSAYKALKDKLTIDCGRVSTANGLTNLTPIEEQYLYPALRDAYNHLSVRTNSDPSVSDLFDARQDFVWFLQDLEHRFPETARSRFK